MNIGLLEKIYKKVKLYTALVVVLSLCFVITTTLGIVFATKENALLVKIVVSIIDILIILPLIYIATTPLPRELGYKRYAKIMNKANPSEIVGRVNKISDDKITLVPGVRAFEVEIAIEDSVRKIYLCDILDKDIVKLGQTYTFYVVSSFIKEVKQ